MSDWPIGLSTGCFYRTDVFEVLEPIRDGGFSMLEISSAPRHLDFHDREVLERLARRLHDLDLEVYSFHAPYGPSLDISSLDRAERWYAQQEMLLAVEAAARLNARWFVIHPGPESDARPSDAERMQRLRHAASVLVSIAERCAEHGVGLCMENMLPHLLFGNASDTMWLLGALRHHDVGFCFDTGHAFLGRDVDGIVRSFAGRLRLVHAHDNHAERDDHLPPGEGRIDWTRLLERLHEVDFHGGLVLELSGDLGADPAELLERARRARWRIRDGSRRLARPAVRGRTDRPPEDSGSGR